MGPGPGFAGVVDQTDRAPRSHGDPLEAPNDFVDLHVVVLAALVRAHERVGQHQDNIVVPDELDSLVDEVFIYDHTVLVCFGYDEGFILAGAEEDIVRGVSHFYTVVHGYGQRAPLQLVAWVLRVVQPHVPGPCNG